jgi:hypothetical protein
MRKRIHHIASALPGTFDPARCRALCTFQKRIRKKMGMERKQVFELEGGRIGYMADVCITNQTSRPMYVADVEVCTPWEEDLFDCLLPQTVTDRKKKNLLSQRQTTPSIPKWSTSGPSVCSLERSFQCGSQTFMGICWRTEGSEKTSYGSMKHQLGGKSTRRIADRAASPHAPEFRLDLE